MQVDDALSLAGRHDGPVLIAGPTASGKSALALAIAEVHGGQVINADALQVYARWRILTARPTDADLARAPHALYGHVPGHARYSVGHWLADIAPLLRAGPRPIVVGGTGLYLSALAEGLSEIPDVPAEIRGEADRRRREAGPESLLADLDPATRARIDAANPARVQRAWEVLQATGTGLAAWQSRRSPPLMPLWGALALVLDAPPARLNPRLAARFDAMLAEGALDEVRGNADDFDPSAPADRAIGVAELVDVLNGSADLAQARERAVIATRQYAKRQRTWFRARMRGWHHIRV